MSLEMQRVSKRLEEKKIKLDLKEGGKQWLAETGYDPEYGARPLKRTIQRSVETQIAKGILAGQFPSGSTVTIDAGPEDNELSITSDVAPVVPSAEVLATPAQV